MVATKTFGDPVFGPPTKDVANTSITDNKVTINGAGQLFAVFE